MSDFTKIQAEINRLSSKIANSQKELGDSKLVFPNGMEIHYDSRNNQGLTGLTVPCPDYPDPGPVEYYLDEKSPEDDDDWLKNRKIQREYHYMDNAESIEEDNKDYNIKNKIYREDTKLQNEKWEDYNIAHSYANEEGEEDED